jgi:shikimate kinase
MMKKMNVFLVGPMGAGKTTIGRQLAKNFKLEFFDSDHEIEARAGADIAWIFDVEGERGFRQREERVIEDLTTQEGIVLATGAGVVISPANRRFLSSRGIVVYISASIDQQLQRLNADRRDHRQPLLQGSQLEARLTELNHEHTHLYEEIADHIITPETHMQAIITEITTHLMGHI